MKSHYLCSFLSVFLISEPLPNFIKCFHELVLTFIYTMFCGCITRPEISNQQFIPYLLLLPMSTGHVPIVWVSFVLLYRGGWIDLDYLGKSGMFGVNGIFCFLTRINCQLIKIFL